MATHDYIIDNQSASAFRSDLNGALQAIVTQNSNATAPTTTYVNMIWYDTAANQLKKRNEADSAWITLGTIDEATGTFLPNAIASQAQAEAGTSNTLLMTPLRTAQAISTGTSGIAAGAVGSYAFLRDNGSTADYAFGATLAGSNLNPAGLNTLNSSSEAWVLTEATAQTGTWRCMGFADYSGLGPRRATTLWLRIS